MKDEEKPRAAQRLYECWQRMLPDGRLLRPTGMVRGPLGMMLRLFCVNCGAAGGYVTETAIAHVFFLCDACVLKHGHLPLPEAPAELMERGPGR